MDCRLGPLVFRDLLEDGFERKLSWEPFRKGIEISRIYYTPGGASAAFLRYAPGAALGRHEHPGWEHILVLRGFQTDDTGEHHAGDLLLHPAGTSHAITTTGGCVVLAIWEKPVNFVRQEAGGTVMKRRKE